MDEDVIDQAFDGATGNEFDPEDSGIDTIEPVPEERLDAERHAEEQEAAIDPDPDGDGGEELPTEEVPDEQPVEASGDRFTRVDRDALPPEVQRLHDQMQAEYEAQLQGLGRSKEDLAQAQEHAEFIRAVAQNPDLQRHIQNYFAGEQGQPQDQGQLRRIQPDENPEGLDYFEPESQQDVQHILNIARQEAKQELQNALKERDAKLDRYEQHFAEMERQREEEELTRKYPDWDKHVNAEDLRAAQKVAPNLPLASLLKILDYDNVAARAGRTARSEQIAKLTRRRVPPPNTGRKVDHVKVPTTYDEIWDDVIEGGG